MERKHKKVALGENSKVEAEKTKLGKSISIGKNTIIKGKEVCIEDNVVVGDDTTISAESIFIGFGTTIENRCRITLSGKNTKFSVHDNCLIGHDSKILVPIFETGDYVMLNNHLLVNGVKPCTIGHNVWIGQNCVLNARDKLTIGNGVGIGTYNCVWTHGAHGELLEGCNIFKIAPVIIEDDVWLVGSFNVVSPGVTIGKKAVALTGSVITKDVAPNSVVAGNPAKDITDKISPYREIALDEKYEIMKKFMQEFVDAFCTDDNRRIENGWSIKKDESTYEIVFLEEANDKSVKDDLIRIIFTKKNATTKNHEKVTIFDLSSKKYTKKRTEIEIEIMKFLLYPRARFYPSEDTFNK
jgi:acetyltransferase-like isoleucine patch superfamily enzyme